MVRHTAFLFGPCCLTDTSWTVGEPGSLIFRINVLKHPLFTRRFVAHATLWFIPLREVLTLPLEQEESLAV